MKLNLKKVIPAAVIAVLAVIVIFSCFTVVGAGQSGVIVTTEPKRPRPREPLPQRTCR